MSPDVHIADEPDAHRYVVTSDGAVAGFAQYRARPGLIAFIHTEVDERFAGRGLASRLIAFALDDARARGMAVLPFCPFVNHYIEQHREYADLVLEGHRAEFGL